METRPLSTLAFLILAPLVAHAAPPAARIALDPAGPLRAGPLRVAVEFDRPMDPQHPPQLHFRAGELAPAEQGWTDPRTFSAAFAIPADFPNGENALLVSSAADSAGEAMAEAQSAPFVVDTRPPEIGAASLELAGGQPYAREAAFTVVPRGFTDATTQIAAYYLGTEDGGGTRKGQRFEKETTFTATQEGEVTLYAWAEDAAGNLSAAVSGKVVVDTQAPAVASAALDRTGVLGSGVVHVELGFSEVMDPQASLEVRFGPLGVEGAWTGAQNWAGTLAIGPGIPDGAHALAVQGGRDLAGHPLAPFTGPSVEVDQTPPDLSAAQVSIEGGAAVSADKRLEFEFGGFADNTRIIRFSYAFEDLSASRGGTESQDGRTGTLSEAPEGVNRVYVWAEDAAGNISRAVSDEILVDTQRPSVEQATAGPPSTTGAGALPVELKFNRGMDPAAAPKVILGGQEVPGSWADTLIWKGLYEIGPSTRVGAVEMVVSGALDQVGHPMREEYRRTVEIPGEALYLYGMARHQEGDAAGAEAAFDRVLEAQPEHVETRYERAMLYGEQGRLDQQLAELEQVVRMDPYLPKAHYALAGLYTDRNQLDQAAQALEKVVAIEKGGAGMASPYARPNRDLMGLVFAPLELVRAPAPTPANVLHQSGVVDARNGDLDKAVGKLQQAIEAGAGPVAHYNLGTVYLHQGLWPEAEAELEAALQAGAAPEYSVRINLGAAQIARGRAKQAEGTYVPMGSYTDPAYLSDLAVLQAKRGREDEALGTLALLNPVDPAVLVTRGAILLQAERYPEAEASFRQVLAQDPSRAEAHLGLAQGREAQEDYAGARDACRAAIAARLEYVDAHYRLGQALLKLRDAEGAAVEFQRAVDIAPDFAEAQAALGTAYGQQDLKEKAAAQYQKAGEAKKKAWAQRPKGMKVALLSFKNETGDRQMDWLSTGIPEALSADLVQVSDFDLLERLQMEKVLKEKTGAELGAIDEAQAPAIGKLLGAEALVIGSFQVAGKDLRLDARLVEPQTGRTLSGASVSGSLKKVIKLERELALELAQASGAAPDPEAEKAMLERAEPSEDAFKLASQAKEKLYAGDQAAAQELSTQALQADASALDVVAGIDMIDAAARQGKTLAVLPFANTTGQTQHDWLKDGVAEALTTDLSKIAGLYLVERRRIQELNQEKSLAELGATEGTEATEVGRLLGAGVLMMGSYQVVGEGIRIDARMLSVAQGTVLLAAQEQGEVKKLLEIEGKLALQISEALGVAVSRAEQTRIEEKPAEAMDALKQLVELRQLQAEKAEGQMVAVTPFANTRGLTQTNWLASGIAEGLSTEFSRRGLPMVERLQFAQLLQETSLAEMGAVAAPEEEDALLAKKLGARYLVVGSYLSDAQQLRIDSRLLDTSTDAVLASTSTQGSTDDLFRLQGEIAERYLDTIKPDKEKGGKDHFRLPTKLLFALAVSSGAGWGSTHYMFTRAEDDYLAGQDNYEATNRYYRSRRGFQTSTQVLASSMVFSWLWNHTLAR